MSDRILKRILLTLACLNWADYLFTLRAVYVLGIAEGNPVMDAALGSPMFFITKVLLVPAGLFLIWHVRHNIRRPVMYFTAIPFAAYSLLTAWHIYGQFIV